MQVPVERSAGCGDSGHNDGCGLMEKQRMLAGLSPHGGGDVSLHIREDAQDLALSHSSHFSVISNN